ncbi:MAG: hypothetical protein AB1469_01245 [Pseudomonadota bacterium]
MHTDLCRRGLTRLALLAALLPAPAHAEFILFPQLNQVERRGVAPGINLEEHEFKPGVDIFYSSDHGRLRLLGEFEILRGKKPKAGTVERLQAGWLLNPDTTVWLGRHHTPFGYWNTEYHHGSYLQSAVTRPGIIDFGSGAPLARHLTGLLLESAHAGADESGLRYSFSVGASPGVGSGLKEFDILDFNDGNHSWGSILRVTHHWGGAHHTEMGAFAGYMLLPGNNATLHEVRQTVLGALGNWEHRRVRVLGEAYWVNDIIDRPAGNASGSFINVNLQVEYKPHEDWVLYARAEDTFGGDGDPYLGFFPTFIEQRGLAGVTYMLTPNQAIKLEAADVRLQSDRFTQINLQWSAAFP